MTPDIDLPNATIAAAHQTSKRMIELVRELEKIEAQQQELRDELFIVSEQYHCHPHDFQMNHDVEKCTKCGFEYVPNRQEGP